MPATPDTMPGRVLKWSTMPDDRLPDSDHLTLLSKVVALVPRGRVILMIASGAPDRMQALAALVARARA
ncbi:MAG TPA: hypothetical protein VH417_19840 [Vicinamibacterales bacterium]|jgi:hypothetical protein